MTNRLVCTSPTKTIQGNELLTGVSYTQCVNSETDLQFGQVASAQISFTTTYSGITKNTKINWYCKQHCDSSERLMGYFNVTDVQKNGNSYTVTAYDNITKLDVDCTAFLKNTSANTVYGLFTSLCSSLGLSYDNYSSFIVNGGMTVNPSDLVTAGITARTVMHYIAEAAAAHIIAKPNGHIFLDIFGIPGGTATSVTASDYSTLTIADQPAPQVSKVTVQLSNGSCTSGSGDAAMQYLFNPLFYNKSAGSIQTNVDNIRKRATGGTVGGTWLPGISAYYACNLHMYDDKKINAGDIISVDGKPVLVMTKKISPSGCDIICTGEPTRATVVMENTDKISNLEANKANSNYITLDWLTTNGNKIFNSTITVNDVYIPSGLGYLNNPACTSLVEVIQALLTKNEINPSSSTVNLNMTEQEGPYHTYTTPAYDNSWAVSTTGSVSYAGNVITCTGTTNGSVVFTKTITYPDHTSRVVTYTYNINCYSYIVNHGYDFYLDYVGEQSYEHIAYRVYKDGVQVVPYTENTDVDNTYISVECDVTAGLRIVFKQTGTYTFEKSDAVHAFPEQTYKILSV